MKKSMLFLLCLVSFQAWAGDSGCGLGSVIIQKNSKGLQLLSMTTNSILFTQPLGITSGTSGCSSSGLVQNEKQMQYFVEVNHEELRREMAQGQGEKLFTLAQLSGCKSAESQKVFGEWTQKSYSKLVPEANISGADLASNIKKELSVAAVCGREISSL